MQTTGDNDCKAGRKRVRYFASLALIVALSLATTFLVAWAYDIHNSEKFVSRKHIYEIVISEAKNAIVIVDKAGKVVVFNRAAEKLFEIERNDVIGKDSVALIPREFQRQHSSGFLDALAASDGLGASPYRHPSPKTHPVYCYIETASGARKPVRLDVRDLGDQMLAIIEQVDSDKE